MFTRLKAAYSLYNFFQKKKLKHNLALYKKLGLRKRYFSPVSSKDFVGVNAEVIRQLTSLRKVEETVLYSNLDAISQESISTFDENGFAVLRGYLSHQQVDAVNVEVERLLKDGMVKFTNGNKIMFAIHHSPMLRAIGNDDALKDLLSALIGDEVKLFQSINFLTGSEQHTHSDSIHMTTFPEGGLLGVWIALEDIDFSNGPLHYYPGSHKLPYYLNGDYHNEGNFFFLGQKDYTEYEAMIAEKIASNQLQKQVFTASKGDLLVWHANLFHGGEPQTDKSRTRKSMVLHYFGQNFICYHEITQRPALMP